jgi:hypothetical protein
MDEEKSYRSEVQGILEDLKTATISIGNHKKYVEKVRNTESIIKAQIENNKQSYTDMLTKYKEVTGKQTFKDNYDGGIVAADFYDMIKDMNRVLQDTYGWKSLQLELNSVLMNKMIDIMGDTQALDIKRDALKEMREDTERRNKLFLDSQKENNELLKSIMHERYLLMEEKMNLFMSVVMDKVNSERRALMHIVEKVVDKVGEKTAADFLQPVKKEDIVAVESDAAEYMRQRAARRQAPMPATMPVGRVEQQPEKLITKESLPSEKIPLVDGFENMEEFDERNVVERQPVRGRPRQQKKEEWDL